jgi:phosphate acetyltransferase
MTLIQSLVLKAQKKNARILLPESSDDRVLKAAIEISNKGIAKVVLLGDEKSIQNRIKELGVEANKIIDFIDLNNQELITKYSNLLWNKRKNKGLEFTQAQELVKDRTVFSLLLLADGRVDGVVTGAITPSKVVLSNALKIIGVKDNVELVSSFFIMIFDELHKQYGKEMIFSDCAMNVNPNSKELASIAITTSKTAKNLLGIEPKVAMLSFATHESNNHELVIKVRDATNEFRKINKNSEIVGNIQLDAAMDSSVLKVKHPESKFKPPANVLIFPNLDSGNIGYKLVQRFSNAQAIGPILQGLKRPVNDLSRGCSVEEIIKTVAVTVNQCE